MAADGGADHATETGPNLRKTLGRKADVKTAPERAIEQFLRDKVRTLMFGNIFGEH